MQTIEIRQISHPSEDPALAVQVAGLVLREIRGETSDERLESEVRSLAGLTTVVAHDDANQVLATASLGKSDGCEGIVRGVVSAPDYRGRGLGKIVVRSIEDIARARGLTRLWLSSKRGATGFYERLGYEAQPNQSEDERVVCIKEL